MLIIDLFYFSACIRWVARPEGKQTSATFGCPTRSNDTDIELARISFSIPEHGNKAESFEIWSSDATFRKIWMRFGQFIKLAPICAQPVRVMMNGAHQIRNQFFGNQKFFSNARQSCWSQREAASLKVVTNLWLLVKFRSTSPRKNTFAGN